MFDWVGDNPTDLPEDWEDPNSPWETPFQEEDDSVQDGPDGENEYLFWWVVDSNTSVFFPKEEGWFDVDGDGSLDSNEVLLLFGPEEQDHFGQSAGQFAGTFRPFGGS